MIDLYIQETNQLLDRLEQIIIECEKTANLKEHINEIFRIMHTIKGNSMMMMYDGISELSHSAEDVFDFYRQNPDAAFSITDLTDMMLEVLDFSKAQIVHIENDEPTEKAPSDLLDSIHSVLESVKFMNPASEVPEKPKVEPKYFVAPVAQTEPHQEPKESLFYRIKIQFQQGCEMENIRAFTVQHNFKNFTDLLITYPINVVDDEKAAEYIKANGFHMIFQTSTPEPELQSTAKGTAFVENYTLENITSEQFEALKAEYRGEKKPVEQKQVTSGESKTVSSGSQTNHINVDVSKIDFLMDLIGELVVSEAMVTRNPDIHGLISENFEKAARQHRMIINELQDLVMSVRMVPLNLTFQKMNRIVRDMSKKVNKKVSLSIVGEDTEVDKNVIEHIGDPLMHIIRNSVDHGIEEPQERRMLGKPEEGHVSLEAKHSGSEVWIIIEDDGRGLDRERLLEKAEEKGLIRGNPSEMTDSEVFSLIFAPGFSTKDAITEYSGRGVGLDVVSRNIAELGGTIQIESKLGSGTLFKIKIPLTLAIIEGMMMKVGHSMLTVPIINVQESFNLKDSEVITDPNGNEFIMVRGKCYPIIRLHKKYEIETDCTEISKGILVMVEYGGRSVLLFADELLGEQQLVVKSLSKFMRKVKGISGCALLGDGKISLIIDPSGILDEER